MNWFKSWQKAANNHKQMADIFLGEVIFWSAAVGNQTNKIESLTLLAVIHQNKAFRCAQKMLKTIDYK